MQVKPSAFCMQETLHALGPWCCGRIAQHLMSQVRILGKIQLKPVLILYIYIFTFECKRKPCGESDA